MISGHSSPVGGRRSAEARHGLQGTAAPVSGTFPAGKFAASSAAMAALQLPVGAAIFPVPPQAWTNAGTLFGESGMYWSL